VGDYEASTRKGILKRESRTGVAVIGNSTGYKAELSPKLKAMPPWDNIQSRSLVEA
jgi:hypothetical protein